MITVLANILSRNFPRDISGYDWEHFTQKQDLNLRYFFIVSFDVGYIIDSRENKKLRKTLRKYSTLYRTSAIGCSYITDKYDDIDNATQDIHSIFLQRKDICRFGDIQSLQPLVFPICLYVNDKKYTNIQTKISDSEITITCPTYAIARDVLQECMIYTEYLAAIHQCDNTLSSYRFIFDDNTRNAYLYSMSQYANILSCVSSRRCKQLFEQLQIRQQSKHLLYLIDVLQTTTSQQVQYNMHITELKLSIFGLFISLVTFAGFILQLFSPYTRFTSYVSIGTFLFVVISAVYCIIQYHSVDNNSKIPVSQNQSPVINNAKSKTKDPITVFDFDSLTKGQQKERVIYHPEDYAQQ